MTVMSAKTMSSDMVDMSSDAVIVAERGPCPRWTSKEGFMNVKAHQRCRARMPREDGHVHGEAHLHALQPAVVLRHASGEDVMAVLSAKTMSSDMVDMSRGIVVSDTTKAQGCRCGRRAARSDNVRRHGRHVARHGRADRRPKDLAVGVKMGVLAPERLRVLAE